MAEVEADGSKFVRTELMPNRMAVSLSFNAAGEQIIFGEAGALLRFGSEGAVGLGLLHFTNAPE